MDKSMNIRDLVKYTKQVYRSQWNIDVDTVVVKDSEFEVISNQPICYSEGVRIIPESYFYSDDYEDNEMDIGYYASLLRK